MFKKTTPYFSKWLNYGLATMFSSALLAAMASISTDLVEIIARVQFKDEVFNTAFEFIAGGSSGGGNVSGVFQSAMNQLRLGLMLSTVLIIVPPMAGSWFNGMMGTFASFNHFGGWNGSHAATAPSPGSGMPNTPPQTQSVNYQTNAVQPHSQSVDATQRITRAIATNSGQASNPTTSPANSLVGVGNRTRQSEPNNNGGNTNGQA